MVVAALAMLELLQPELLAAADFGAVSTSLKTSRRLFDADLFIETFGGVWERLVAVDAGRAMGALRVKCAGELAVDPQQVGQLFS